MQHSLRVSELHAAIVIRKVARVIPTFAGCARRADRSEHLPWRQLYSGTGLSLDIPVLHIGGKRQEGGGNWVGGLVFTHVGLVDLYKQEVDS